MANMAKTVYVKCPRCDLNFIQKKDKVCHVCKQEMQVLATNYVDEQNPMGLCPICKVNYIADEESVCETCSSESDLTKEELDALYGGIAVEKEIDPEDEVTDDEEELEILTLDIEEEEEVIEDEEESDPLDDLDETLDDDDEEEF